MPYDTTSSAGIEELQTYAFSAGTDASGKKIFVGKGTDDCGSEIIKPGRREKFF